MHVAIVGPFDIENYGDHLFRKVLEFQLDKFAKTSRHTKLTYDIFAITSNKLGFQERSERVHGIEEIDLLHKKEGYDAVVVAGGSIIHFEILRQYLDGHEIDYPIWKLWAQSSSFASKNGVYLAWNGPEAPLNFKGWECVAVKELLQAVDYISVRDSESRKSLEYYTKKQVLTIPDTAFLLKEVFSANELPKKLPKILQRLKGGYIVYHCNQRLKEVNLHAVCNQLLRLMKVTGYAVVLLPLAYTNNEIEALRKLNQFSNGSFLLIEDKLELGSIVATIGLGMLYIGLSFHGAITAYCFDVPCIAFDYECRRKTKQLYSMIGRSEFYATEPSGLKTSIARFLENRSVDSNLDHRQFLEPLKIHFQEMLENVENGVKKPSKNIDEIYDLAVYETQQRSAMQMEIRKLSDGYSAAYNAYISLRDSLGH